MFLLGHVEEVISHRRWCAIFGVLIDIFASPFQLPFNGAHVTFEREIVHLGLQPIERTLDRFHPQCSKRSVFRFPRIRSRSCNAHSLCCTTGCATSRQRFEK